MRTINGQTITQLADAAFKKAAEDVIELAIHTNTPIVVWHNGAMARIEATKGMTLESFTKQLSDRDTQRLRDD